MDDTWIQENYKKLRRIKLYGQKDLVEDVVPRNEIFQEFLEFLDFLPYLVGSFVKLEVDMTFLRKDPRTRKRWLRAGHGLIYGRKIMTFGKEQNMDFEIQMPKTYRRDEERVVVKCKTLVKNPEKDSQQLLQQLQLLLDDEINFSDEFKLNVSFCEDGEETSLRSFSYISRRAYHSLPTPKKNFTLKKPYEEAYSFSDIPKIIEFYSNAGDVLAEQCKNVEVSLRCLRPLRFEDLETLSSLSLDHEEVEKVVSTLSKIEPTESYVRRFFGERPISIKTKEDVVFFCKHLFAFEFIPSRLPKNFASFSDEELKSFAYHVVLDFDNRASYDRARENVNAIVKKISKFLKGYLLCGTGTNSFGSHLHFFLSFPEIYVTPAKLQTFDEWMKLPPPRRVLHSLEASLQAFLLKTVAQEDLDVGINPVNPREVACELLAEPNVRYRGGVKAIGSLNSSRRWGVKNFLDQNQMPKSKEKYELQTSSEYFLQNFSRVKEKISFKKMQAYATKNFEAFADFLPQEEAQKVYEIYQRLSLKEPPNVVRWIVRKNL